MLISLLTHLLGADSRELLALAVGLAGLTVTGNLTPAQARRIVHTRLVRSPTGQESRSTETTLASSVDLNELDWEVYEMSGKRIRQLPVDGLVADDLRAGRVDGGEPHPHGVDLAGVPGSLIGDHERDRREP